jgi:NAD-dependent dihydropyrimidine dehydrogenase PreA subunit
MVYVDESLCTGCGLCLDTCERGALTIKDSVASVDTNLCTSCERCTEVCPEGAIISVQVLPERPPSPALAQNQGVQPVWAGASYNSPSGIGVRPSGETAGVPESTGASKLEIAGKLLSGLFGVLTVALERRQGYSAKSSILTGRESRGAVSTGRSGLGRGLSLGRGSRPRGGRRRQLRDGRGKEVEKGLYVRRGGRNGRGRNNTCRGQGRNRLT